MQWTVLSKKASGVARAFPGGWAVRPEDQNVEENEEKLRKNKRTYRKMKKDWGNVLILPTWEWEAGYGPENGSVLLRPVFQANIMCLCKAVKCP